MKKKSLILNQLFRKSFKQGAILSFCFETMRRIFSSWTIKLKGNLGPIKNRWETGGICKIFGRRGWYFKMLKIFLVQ